MKMGNTGAIGKDPADKYPLMRELARKKFPSVDVPDMTPRELQDYLLSHIPAGESDLRELARARSKSVQTYLTETGKLDPSKTVIAVPDSLEPPKEGEIKKSRVVLQLR